MSVRCGRLVRPLVAHENTKQNRRLARSIRVEAGRPLDRRVLETHRQLHRPLDLPAALRALARLVVVE